MCLEDLQLARLTKRIHHSDTASAGGIVKTFPPNEARVGFVLMAPTTSTIELRSTLASSTNTYIIRADTGLDVPAYVNIYQVGRLMIGEWDLRAVAALDWDVIELELPWKTSELREMLKSLP